MPYFDWMITVYYFFYSVCLMKTVPSGEDNNRIICSTKH